MKYLAWFGVVFTTLLTIIYVAVFTPIGNGFIKPFVESKIEEKTQMESRFSIFLFNTTDFEMVLVLNQNNSVKVKGNYSLFSRSLNFSYEVGFQNLQSLSKLAGTPLSGTFFTNGTVKGDLAFMNIDGMTDIGNSKSAYHATLADLTPASFTMKMRDAKLASLLHLFSKNPYATADVDLEVNFKNLISHEMDGEITLKSKNGKIDPRYMKSDFNVTIPTTTFSMDLNAKLKGDDIDYKYDFLSNLFKISSFGKVIPQPFKADIAYSLNIQDLEVLKPITGADIRGALKFDGEAKGDKKNLVVKGKSDIASSDTTFEVLLKDFEPASIRAKVENIEIEKLLYMFKYPELLDAVLDAKLDYNPVQRKGVLEGKVAKAKFAKNQIFDGVKEFAKFDMYKEFFNGDINAKINQENILASLDLSSINAAIKVKEAKLNTKTKQIDTDLMLQVKKDEYNATLKGDIGSPKVTIDFEKFMKTEAGKNVQEKINKGVDELLKKLAK
jgi:hypothetical protein